MIRRYMTDYAGFWRGYCVSRESALIAAVKRVVQDGGNRATIVDRETGEDVARVSLSKDRRRAVVEAVQPFQRKK